MLLFHAFGELEYAYWFGLTSRKFVATELSYVAYANTSKSMFIFVGSLVVRFWTIWRDGKAEVGRVGEEKRREEKRREETRRDEKRREEKNREDQRRSEKRKSQKREDAGARKRWKSRFTLFFQSFVAPEGRKVGSLKRRVRSHVWPNESWKNCAPLWREHVEAIFYKTQQVWSTFESWEVKKVHAVVVPSRFPSQNLQSTPCPDHVCRFRCGFVWQVQGIAHLFKSELCVKGSVTVQLQPLHDMTLHYTTFHYPTLRYTTLITLHYLTLHSTTLQ